jgi:hypothetical protein
MNSVRLTKDPDAKIRKAAIAALKEIEKDDSD